MFLNHKLPMLIIENTEMLKENKITQSQILILVLLCL